MSTSQRKVNAEQLGEGVDTAINPSTLYRGRGDRVATADAA